MEKGSRCQGFGKEKFFYLHCNLIISTPFQKSYLDLSLKKTCSKTNLFNFYFPLVSMVMKTKFKFVCQFFFFCHVKWNLLQNPLRGNIK